jgi:hypothetical protein
LTIGTANPRWGTAILAIANFAWLLDTVIALGSDTIRGIVVTVLVAWAITPLSIHHSTVVWWKLGTGVSAIYPRPTVAIELVTTHAMGDMSSGKLALFIRVTTEITVGVPLSTIPVC